MSKSIYPSIPSPGDSSESMRATLDAVRQTLTMLIMNAQNPSSNFTPSSAAQVFVTNAQLSRFSASLAANAGTTATNALHKLKLPPKTAPASSQPLELLRLLPLPVDVPDDDAAADVGVPIGGVYRNGSVLMIRVI
jgi:hypothetical protein